MATEEAARTRALLAALKCERTGCPCHKSARAGEGLTHCPAHADNSPSLKVSPPNQTVWPLLHCFAGCAHKDVLVALREQGLIPREVRFEVGGQRHYRHDSGAGHAKQMWWDKGASATAAPLYRAETLADLPSGTTVLVTEGETAAEAAVSLGFEAVATVCGAASVPTPEALAALRGFGIVLVPDNDDIGRRHMRRIAGELEALGIPYRRLEVPGLPEKGDLADYTGSEKDLAALVQSAQAWETEPTTAQAGSSPVGWTSFWESPRKADWLCEPLLPRGRRVVTYAAAKEGKSLLALDVAARLATGRPCLDRPGGEPVNVIYLDLEMTEDDLYERLTDMGYGPEDDLSHLFYYVLPKLPPLNKPEGGRELLTMATLHEAQLVVIDTTSAALDGPENDSEFMREFGRLTAMPLKSLGITVWRLDHAGKDVTKGQRGTSAKNDGEDLVWLLTASQGGVTLRATHRRQGWAPQNVNLVRLADPLRHERPAETWPPGTSELAGTLDALGIPLDASNRAARQMLKEHNKSASNETLSKALRWRRLRH